jgi:phosphoribosylformimino-5-aminoimidazole carboxamide ribotide isomerase
VSFAILPAIDLRGGRCVRLFQGDYARETVFSDDPVAMARRWVDDGARWLHIVDLDGAAGGSPANWEAVRTIRAAVDVPIELGGGIRAIETIEELLAMGVDRPILGTRAIEDPGFLAEAGERFGGRLALSIDVRDGIVATRGWKESTSRRAEDLAREAADRGIGTLIVTDIDQDGTNAGSDFAALRSVHAASGLPVIAAGGIASIEHIAKARAAGAAGAVVGRAIYDGTLDLRASLAAVC